MIHLTGQNYNSREIIKNIFSPLIGVISSSSADEICHKNNLSFVELLQPFAKLPSDAHFRDVSGTSVSIRGLRLNFCDIDWRPPQTVLARRMLNESVTNAHNDKTKIVTINDIELQLPTAEPWFENWRETFLTVQFPTDHEFTRHLLSCLIVLSTCDPNIIDTAHKLTQRVQQMQSITPQKLPKWFHPSEVLNSYVLLHEENQGDLSKSQQCFEMLKSTFGDGRCFLIAINSLDSSNTNPEVADYWASYIKRQPKPETQMTDLSASKTPQDAVSVISMPGLQMSETPTEGDLAMLHPLSPVQESATEAINSKFSISSESIASQTINPNVWANDVDVDAPHGACLNARDIENLRHFVQDYAVRALIPYIERLVAILSEAVTNKKGVSKSLLSATKRWFVTSKPGAGTNNQNAVIYTNESSELQTRKLGDLYFMFGHYNLAFQAYHQAKRDFNADSAWQYYAGALEMAALSAFMLGTANRKTYDYMEDAIICYLTVCKLQQFATRATLLSMECLKTARQYAEVAKQLIRMTSEESDLRSALLLEQASYCFLVTQPPMQRKYAFHIVLAGNRYSRAGQRKHAHRCYCQAYQIFQGRCWSLAEDHIQYTIAKQAYVLKRLEEASQSFAHLLRPGSLQNSQQQAAFLKEYIHTQHELVKRNPELGIFPHALPHVVQESVSVLTLVQPKINGSGGQLIPASNIQINSDLLDEPTWHKLEEMIVITAAKNKPFVFKPTRYLFTKLHPAAENPIAVQGECIELSVTLSNSVRCSIVLSNIDLLWKLTLDNDEVLSNMCLYEFNSEQSNKAAVNAAVKTHCVEHTIMEEGTTETLNFKITPKLTGNLNIIGIICHVAINTEPTAKLLGALYFETQQIKSSANKQTKQILMDNRLNIKLVPQIPALSVSFSAIPKDLLAGEVIPITLNLRNLGIAPIEEIYLGCDKTRWITLYEKDTVLPLSILSSYTDLSNEKLVKDKEIRRQHVFRLLQNNDVALKAQEATNIAMWLQAPYKCGHYTIRLLLYYSLPASVVNATQIKYRLLRHAWKINVYESVESEITCVVNNAVTNELGLNINIKNSSTQNQPPQVNELYINSLSLHSAQYKLNESKFYVLNQMELSDGQLGARCLEISKATNFLCCLDNVNLDQASINADKVHIPSFSEHLKLRLSRLDIMTAQNFKQQEQQMPALDEPHGFLGNHETIYFNSNISTEEFNKIVANYVPHATVALNWSAIVTHNNEQRYAYGQHFTKLYSLYETSYCPTKDNDDRDLNRQRGCNEFGIVDATKDELSVPPVLEFDHDVLTELENDDEEFWEPNDNFVGKRCLLEDESFMLTAKA